MTRLLWLPALALLALGWGRVDAQTKGSEDEQAIRKAIEGYAAAFNKGDLEGMMAVWAADADYVDDSGKTIKGRDAIAALFKKTLVGLKGAKIRFQIGTLRFPAANVALEDGISELTSPDGRSGRGRYSAVWIKTGGKWLLSSVRDLPGDADATGPAAKLRELEWLVGDWSHEDKNVTATIACRWVLNRSFLLQEYSTKPKDGEPMTVIQVIGWDPASGQFRSWVFDSRGGHGDGLWSRQGNAWRIASLGTLPGGRQGSATNLIRYVDGNSLIWQSTNRSIDGIAAPDTEVKFVKK